MVKFWSDNGVVYYIHMESVAQKPKTAPKDFFFHLGAIIALYVSVWSILALLFEVITYAFPGPFDEFSFSAANISWQVASLIVIFPIYIVLSWMLLRAETTTPEKRDLSVRKWLLYFTLFIAGGAILADLVVLLNAFLQGEEMTMGFVLKICAVLIVASAVFAYYIGEAKYDASMKFKQYFAAGAAVFVIASIIGGFMVVGSPSTQRVKRFDSTRVEHLQMIQSQIVAYWQHKQALPQTLSETGDPISGFVVSVDPETTEPYGYRITGKESFVLCATFSLPSDERRTAVSSSPKREFGAAVEYWRHGAGEQCFDVAIDPKLYPPIKE